MSDGKGKLPTDSSPAEIDEGWDALDEAIAAAVPSPPGTPQAPSPPDEAAPAKATSPSALPADSEPELLDPRDRHKTDQDHLAVSAEDLATEEIEEDWDVAVPTAKHLPRDLPKAPPGERRVARTIMGVGTPELQAALKARLAKGTPEPEGPSAITRPLAPPAKAAAATPTGPAEASERPLATGPSRESQAPGKPSNESLAETHKVPVISSGSEEIPPISALAATAPLGSVGTTTQPEVPFAPTSPSIEPLTVRMRPGGAPAVTPTTGTRRTQPERRIGQGPSNLALILLWTVALISVGLALYLYFARS